MLLRKIILLFFEKIWCQQIIEIFCVHFTPPDCFLHRLLHLFPEHRHRCNPCQPGQMKMLMTGVKIIQNRYQNLPRYHRNLPHLNHLHRDGTKR